MAVCYWVSSLEGRREGKNATLRLPSTSPSGGGYGAHSPAHLVFALRVCFACLLCVFALRVCFAFLEVDSLALQVYRAEMRSDAKSGAGSESGDEAADEAREALAEALVDGLEHQVLRPLKAYHG